MTQEIFDPTAGERAREIALHPRTPQRVVDPTDPYCGEFLPDTPGHVGDPHPIFDPTNPDSAGADELGDVA